MKTAEMPTMDKRLLALREGKGMTQQSLATAAGLPWSVVAKIEQGVTKNPRLDTLRALARALGVTLDELAGQSEES